MLVFGSNLKRLPSTITMYVWPTGSSENRYDPDLVVWVDMVSLVKEFVTDT